MSQKIYHAAQVENHGVSYLENADFYGNLTGKGLYCLSAYGAEWPDIADSSLATRLSARARALERFFDAVEARNNVCLISYFQALDFSFNAQQHPLTTAKYRERIADPLYTGSAITPPPPPPPPVTYTCPTCGATFNSQSALDAHMASAHPAPEPIPQGVYHFVGLDSTNLKTDITAFNSLVGKTVMGYTHWVADWGGSFAPALAALKPLLVDKTLSIVALNWMPYTNVNDQQTLKSIAAGGQDTYINQVAQQCLSFGYPIYIRLGAEMNINQGSPEPASWAANPVDFVAAWRHIVDLFRSVDNVHWVWNPNYATSPGAPHQMSEYYPGDSYVDWIGIDMYQMYPDDDPSTQMNYLYGTYGSSKPVGIFEWGTRQATSDAARADYLERFFDAVEARNNVCLISYFQALDFSFNAQQHPLTTAKYRQRIASPVYLSSEVVTPPPDTPPTDPADPCKAYKDQVTAYQASIVNLNTQIAQLNANNVILQNTVNTLALKILNVKPLLDQAKAALL